jgi:hypothetical protein
LCEDFRRLHLDMVPEGYLASMEVKSSLF